MYRVLWRRIPSLRERITHQALRAATVSGQEKRWKQYEHHQRSRGCAQAVDFRQSSARERSQACIRREAEDPVPEWRQFRLRGLVVCSPYGCGIQRVFTGRAEHEPHQKERACKTTHTEGRTRNMHAVWPVTDASGWPMLIWMSLLTLTDLGER